MAEGSARSLKNKSSTLRETASNPIARQSKSKIPAEAVASHDGTGSRQGTNNLSANATSTKKRVSNPQLTSPEAVRSATRSVPPTEHLLQGKVGLKPTAESSSPGAGDLPPLTGSERAKTKEGKASTRSNPSALLTQAASKLQDAGPTVGPSSTTDTSSPERAKPNSTKTSQSILLDLTASKIKDTASSNVPSSSASTVPMRTTAPLGVNPSKSALGMSARSIKSTVPSLSISRQIPDPTTSPSPVGTPQVPPSWNPSKSVQDSKKSVQPTLSGQVASQTMKTSAKDAILVPSDTSRKLTRATEAVRQWIWGSKHSVISEANHLRAKEAPRNSTISQIKSQQLVDPSRTNNEVVTRSSTTPGLETGSRSSFAISQRGPSVSEPVLGPINSAKSTMSALSKKAASNKLDETIRLLATKLSSAKTDSRHDLDLPIRMAMCPCPDMIPEHEGEDDEEDEEEQKQSFRSIVKSKENIQRYKRSIRTVTRSPFERKDRAARQEFLKDLERLEITEIEKKQRLKPRKIKKYLKKEGVYQTIKDANLIPGSRTSTSPRHSSSWSIVTYGEKEEAGLSTSVSAISPEESEESDKIDKFQLRGHHSIGSRAAAGMPLLKEEAFLEIELSEADEAEPMPRSSLSLSSSSATEALSSSSEISLKVNLEKAHSSADKKKIKARNAPFVRYKNKIDKEIEAGTKNQIHDTTQENLIIEKIATEFGEWAKENGLKPEAVEKDIIKELFQFGTMDTAANSIAVEIKELIIVPETISGGLYPELEERAALYRQILWDEMAYWKKERSMAFGKPDPFPYKRPPNQPLPLWTKSGFVPLPLATGELLYQSLIDNESLMLERYVLWMVENPKYHRPPYLIKSGYFQKIIDKHGGNEDIIRQNSNAAKHLVNSTGKNLAGLNIGMKTELRKLKEMAKADATVPR